MIPEEGYYQPEVFPWNGGTELTEELSFMKRKVIPFLLNHPYSGPFRLPVNAKAEGIYPDYFKVGHRDTVTHIQIANSCHVTNVFLRLKPICLPFDLLPHVTFALSKAYKLPLSTNFRVFCCTRDKELLGFGLLAMIRTLKAKSQQDIEMAMSCFVSTAGLSWFNSTHGIPGLK